MVHLKLDSFLPYRLSVAANAVSEVVARLYRERFDIGVHEWRVIAILGQGESRAPGEIAALARMDKVSVTRAVQRLERRALLDRTPSSEDLRSYRLSLNPAGRALFDAVAPEALAVEEALLGELEAWERGALDSLLRRIEQRAMQFNGLHLKPDDVEGDGA